MRHFNSFYPPIVHLRPSHLVSLYISPRPFFWSLLYSKFLGAWYFMARNATYFYFLEFFSLIYPVQILQKTSPFLLPQKFFDLLFCLLSFHIFHLLISLKFLFKIFFWPPNMENYVKFDAQ